MEAETTKPQKSETQTQLNRCPRSDRHGRWLTASETLRAQAFPVSVELSDGVPLCSFACPGSTGSGRTARSAQAGNSMHCVIAAIAVLYAAAEVKLQRPRSLSSSLFNLAARLRAG